MIPKFIRRLFGLTDPPPPPPYVFKPQVVGKVVAKFKFDDSSLDFTCTFRGESYAYDADCLRDVYATKKGNAVYSDFLRSCQKRGFIFVRKVNMDVAIHRVLEIELTKFPDYTVTNTKFGVTENK